MAKKKPESIQSGTLRETPLEYPVWGAEQIEETAHNQMAAAMRLPVAAAGALMPDAHYGYGLPVGGVLATDGVVIPYAVGVDIACRMRLTVFDASPIVLDQKPGQFEKALREQTLFGSGSRWKDSQKLDHEVLHDPAWDATYLLRSLKDIGYHQLGSSGTGNHFVNWGAFELLQADPQLGLKPGKYLSLLSHSGSRGVGFKIANHYSELARQIHPMLDQSVRHLAWLPLTHEAGEEYWIAMELAGRYASANHEVIHHRLAKAIGMKPAATVENHHNFAWKEMLPAPAGFGGADREVIVHRKGATPAGPGVLGVIPGSMADPGYVVRGKGNAASLNSASHGAGRAMSRKDALKSITKTERDRYLKERDVKLIGAGLDESPQAYKQIEQVINAQLDLVELIGRFTPRMVRMAAEKGES